MDEFELGRATLAETEPVRPHSDRTIYHLNKLFRISRKYYARVFLSSLKSHVLRALIITAQRNPVPAAVVYPAEETIEFQFLSMCASKIQAVFRGYVTRKYYLEASNRLRQFQRKMSAVVAAWKTRRIMQCAKIQEAISVIRTKRKEVLKQQQTVEMSPNTYTRKKLEYLLKSLREEIRLLIDRFHQFYQSDAWVFEPKSNFTLRAPNTTKGIDILKLANQQQIALQSKAQEQAAKPKRVRQMRDRNRKPLKVEQKEEEGQPSSQIIIEPTINMQQPIPKVKNQQEMRMNFQDSMEERPIKAKGSYQLQEADVESLLAPPNATRKGTTDESGPPESEADSPQTAGPNKKSKAADKAKLDKRQKYDPRKAILQEKKKKELKKVEVADQTQPTSGGTVKGQAQAVKQKKDNKAQQKNQTAKDYKTENNTEPMGEGSSLARATVAYERTNKGRAEPKIDCWANRKTNKGKLPDENRNTYRAIHSKGQKNVSKSIDQIKQELVTHKNSQRTKLETVQPQHSISNQRLRDETELNRVKNISYANCSREREAELRKAESFPEMRAGKYLEPKKTEAVEREGHKYIDQIEAVYTNQYQSRMQIRTASKADLTVGCTAARKCGPNSCSILIPQLCQTCDQRQFLKQQILGIDVSIQLIASRIEKTFKDFDKV